MEATRFLPLLVAYSSVLPFLVSGLGKLAAFGPTTAYISSVGLPLAPLGCGNGRCLRSWRRVVLILGFRVREVALGLARVHAGGGRSSFITTLLHRNQMIHFSRHQ